jgi:hypothetical protein
MGKSDFYGFMGECEEVFEFLNEWKSFAARFPIMQINFITAGRLKLCRWAKK